MRREFRYLKIVQMRHGGDFTERIEGLTGGHLFATDVSVLQVNLGFRCNMSCRHCHADAGPGKTQSMTKETVEMVIEVLSKNELTLDITGGAPEMNPNFSYLIEKARALKRRVIVRTNLTIFLEEGMKNLPAFLSGHAIGIVASLPCYTEDNVDGTRGKGTFKKCVEVLKILNALGYGSGSGQKRLDLVYNPSGPFLPPPQKRLEEDYKRELMNGYGIVFDSLYAFTNMPIGRFGDLIEKTGLFDKYRQDLVSAFNPDTLTDLMCRRLVSVGWDGRMYDCDFNQMLGIALNPGCPQHIRGFDYSLLKSRAISIDDHCYACTAGQGST